MHIIETTQLCKSYGTQQVLHDVEFSVETGKLVGFLGPNGAGKSTTIRILLGLLSQSTGDAKVFGKSCRQSGKEIRAEIGYLAGDVHFYPNLKGQATLEFLARARRKNCTDEFKRLASAFELPLNRTVRKYSTGMRQKLGLIQALMHKPKLLVLDEPTSGLDPLARQAVFSELRNVIKEGRTILFSSHSLDEVEELCDEVIILREGRIVEHQSVETLRERALRRVEVSFIGDVPDPLPPEFQIIKRSPSSVLGTWSGDIEKLLAWVGSQSINDLIIERPDLNDLFITYY